MVRFLASVPSVIYGLLGVLVLVPFIGNHLITEHQKASVAGIISLTGYSLMAAIIVLTIMIAPLMVSIFTDALNSVKPGWLEGSLALGVNRWRTIWKIGVRAARPAIVAGTVLALARAIGESVMLAMLSGSTAFAPNPVDGLIFIFEPSRPLAPTIVKSVDQLSSPPAKATLFAIASFLLFSAAHLLAGRLGDAAVDEQVPGAMTRSRAHPRRPAAAVRRTRGRRPRRRRAARRQPPPTGAVEGSSTWSLLDRLGLAFCWFLGLLFCAIAAAIVIYLLIKGIQYLKPSSWSPRPPRASPKANPVASPTPSSAP